MRIPSTAEMEPRYARVEAIVETLLARGCRVVFLRMPTGDECWELDEQHWPKAKYWDRFAQGTKAETVHFRDYESLNRFECPDCSHLDDTDAVQFTAALAEILFREGE